MGEDAREAVKDEARFTELRRQLLDATVLKTQRFLGRIEVQPNHRFHVFLPEQPTDAIRIRGWTHGEMTAFQRLPFYGKVLANEKLTEPETLVLNTFQRFMVNLVIEDVTRWRDTLEKTPSLVDQLFSIALQLSGWDADFEKELEEFMSSDAGYVYGFVWFTLMRKTPSEVACLPETDVKAVNSWIIKWRDRVKSVS